MPKYKVGDVAALFPKPSAPKSDTAKKIQTLFDDFYKNSKKYQQTKKQMNNKSREVPESPGEIKKKKRKHIEDEDSASSQPVPTLSKQKKVKLDSIHQNSNGKAAQNVENYFPRNKKKSKHFNSIKENSSAFPQMDFDEGEDESFSNFDQEEHTMSDQKKKKKKKSSEIKTTENDSNEIFNSKSSKKMKKFANSKNQSEEFSLTATSAFDEPMKMQQSPDKKSKKKKNKKQKKDKIAAVESVADDIHSDEEDIDIQSDEEPKIKIKSKKMKKSLASKSNMNDDSGTENDLEENGESSEVTQNKKKLQKKPPETAERVSRTLFVGNLPVKMTRQGLQKLFSPFGPIEACRLRGSVPVKTTIPKKVAAIKNEFHAGQKSCIGYVVFKEVKDAKEALSLNGELVGDHHIVVNPASSAGEKKTYDDKRSIFIGNLPFDVEDEAIWSAFAACGEVEAVRAIRDPETGAGKGFGYVLFKTIDSKETALRQEGVEISNRKIRIKEVKSNAKKPVPSNNNQLNALRRKAKKMKGKPNGPRKSLKKLMNREKRNYQKKKIANIFKKFST